MKPTYIFPVIMIALQIGAAVAALCHHEHKTAVYWLAAAVLNAAVTF